MAGAELPGRPLRFAVMLDAPRLAQWQSDCLRNLHASGHAELQAVLVKQSNANSGQRKSLIDKALRNPRLLWNAYNGRFVSPRVPALRPTDLTQLTDHQPMLVEPLKQGRFGERMPDDVIRHLRSLNLDFILRLGFGILKGDVLECARYGVWSFHHGDPEWVRGVPPGFWEVYKGRPATGVILQQLNEKLDAGRVLHRGFFPTDRHSYPATLQTVLSAASHFPARICAEIRASGALPEVQTGTLAPIRYSPDNQTMLRFLARQARRKVQVVRRFRWQRQQWNVALLPAPIAVCAGLHGKEAQTAAFAQARWMDRAPDTFRADPFPIRSRLGGDRITVAFELYNWTTQRGTIATAWTEDGGRTFSPAVEILSLPTHLSYPLTLSLDYGEVVIPENSEGRLVKAYHLDEAGHILRPAFDIMRDVPLIDATFLQWEGRWYAFGVLDKGSRNTSLHIYHAEQLEGPWAPHSLNPICCDVTGARPAGAFFTHEGKLYRPAQDCAEEYGHRIAIHQVEELSPTAYRETRVAGCAPHPSWPYSDGMHTLSDCAGATLIDAYRIDPVRKG